MDTIWTSFCVLRAAHTRATGPVLIHCCTVKGKGYAPAEASADKYHGVAKFDVANRRQSKPARMRQATQGVWNSVDQAAERIQNRRHYRRDALGHGHGYFADHFPARMFDVGIAEQHGVTFAAGWRRVDFKPFCAIYSRFSNVATIKSCMTWLCKTCPCVSRLTALDWWCRWCRPMQVPLTWAISALAKHDRDGRSDEAELVHMVATAACA